MKPEPLTNGLLVDEKEKTLKIVSQRFWLDLKERVNWLLKEIEKRIEELNKYEKMGFTKQFCANRRDELRTYIVPLIKKAFSGVIEE